MERILESNCTPEVKESIYISMDLLEMQESIEELEALRKSRIITKATFDLSVFSIRKQKQILINQLNEIVKNRQEKRSFKIG